MRRSMMLLMCAAAIGLWTTPGLAVACKGCDEIKAKGEGFCIDCGSGKIFSLKLASKMVYDLLTGSEAMADKFKDSPCPGCKKAFATNGSCTHCKVHFADGRVFKSAAAHTLAGGKFISPTKAEGMEEKCPSCAKSFKSNGFCSGCNVGFVANRSFGSQESYDKALKAHETVKAAVKDAQLCDQCATARLTDGTCKSCKVSFKDGKPSTG